MFNPYIIILSLFIVAGLIATIWGWTIIAKGQKTLRWPNVEGIIEESRPASDADDLLPHILFSYTVAAQTYRCTVEFSSGITPTQEFTASYMKDFPLELKSWSITILNNLTTPHWNPVLVKAIGWFLLWGLER